MEKDTEIQRAGGREKKRDRALGNETRSEATAPSRPREEPPPAEKGGCRGSARPAGCPTRPLGREEAPGRLPTADASGYPAQSQPRAEGGQPGVSGPSWLRPEVASAHPPLRDDGRRQVVGDVDSALGTRFSLPGQPFHFSRQSFNRAGAGPL